MTTIRELLRDAVKEKAGTARGKVVGFAAEGVVVELPTASAGEAVEQPAETADEPPASTAGDAS